MCFSGWLKVYKCFQKELLKGANTIYLLNISRLSLKLTCICFGSFELMFWCLWKPVGRALLVADVMEACLRSENETRRVNFLNLCSLGVVIVQATVAVSTSMTLDLFIS